MSSTTIYRLRCDAPGCTTTSVVESITDTPDGWTRIRSDAHLDDWKPPIIKLRNGRTRLDKRDRWDVTAGKFTLHLCAEHPDTFAAHLPLTIGSGVTGNRDRHITVKCSCGELSTWVNDMHMVRARSEGPSRTPEFAWWRHLPTELQGYALRDQKEGQ